jgi:hypothetical protein
MRLVLFPLTLAHTIYSLGVLASILGHDLLRRRGWDPEIATVAYLALGSMIGSALLVLLIVAVRRRIAPRYWTSGTAARRERTQRRAKALMKVLAITFLAGGFLFMACDLFKLQPERLGHFALAMLGCPVILFFISTPWLALSTAWFDADS